MKHSLFFLEAANGQALTKKFSRPQRSKPIQKTNYPHVREFNSYEASYRNLKDFSALLRQYAKRGACLLKGHLNAPLKEQSRAGSTHPDTPTNWLCLDFDGLRGVATADEALALVGIEGVDYVLQYSASSGILRTDTFDAHIFLLLDDEVSPQQIKLWLKHINLTVPEFSEQITLTRSHNALRWPLDISVNQNDKLLFIAPPEVYDGIQDPLKGRRIRMVSKRGNAKTLSADLFTVPDVAKTDAAQRKKLNELRKELGLPSKRTLSTKIYKGVSVGASPTTATVTGIKEERGYVYLNLNGGDSWGYFFPLANPEILYNFKGEQNYALKEIAPEIYREYKNRAAEHRREEQERKLKEQQTGKAYVAFLDRRTDTYYRGTYDYDEEVLDLEKTGSLVKIQHFLKQHGEPVGDFVPEWDYVFDFQTNTLFDPERRFANRYRPSDYLRNPTTARRKDPFPTIRRIIQHALCDDGEIYQHFLNWLAFIFQYREPARTAWVLHGIQGTGKGVLFNYIITPLAGRDYVQTKRITDLEDGFNGFMDQTLFMLLDEVQITDAKNADSVMAKIKNYIVEPVIPIRAMRTDHYMAPNWMNIILASNKPNPIQIDPTDRRFNVATYQTEKLVISNEDITTIEEELPAFAHQLLSMEVDAHAARTPIDTEAKDHIKYLTRSSIDLFADALNEGNLQYFFEALPAPSDIPSDLDVTASMKQQYYIGMVRRFFASFDQKTHPGRMNISRDDLIRLAEYILGKVPTSPNKFSAYVKHHGINIGPVKVKGKTVQGVQVNWKASRILVEEWSTLWLPQETTPTKNEKVVPLKKQKR